MESEEGKSDTITYMDSTVKLLPPEDFDFSNCYASELEIIINLLKYASLFIFVWLVWLIKNKRAKGWKIFAIIFFFVLLTIPHIFIITQGGLLNWCKFMTSWFGLMCL